MRLILLHCIRYPTKDTRYSRDILLQATTRGSNLENGFIQKRGSFFSTGMESRELIFKTGFMMFNYRHCAVFEVRL